MSNWEFVSDEQKPLPTEKLPVPTGHRVLVRPLRPASKVGSLIIPETSREKEEIIANVGQVIAVGPNCWALESHGDTPWAAVGDYVLFSKHTGHRFKVDGNLMILMNDDEVQATVPDPEVISSRIV